MSPSPSRSAVPRRSCPSVRRPTPRTTKNHRQLFFMNRSRSILISTFAGLLAFTASALGQSRTIVLDAGHGGYDRGGVPGQRISEKDKTLDVAVRLRRVLQASGYKVVMTRDQDVFVTLGTRVAIANSYRNAVFVSIHFNCSTRSGANGIET